MLGNFFNKKEEAAPAPKAAPKRAFARKKDGMIYDDEVDTVSRAPWSPTFVDNGGEDGEDLAMVGGVYYLAFIPFLLFVLAFSTGAFSFGYSKGNF